MSLDITRMAALIERIHERETDPGGALNIVAWMQEADAIVAAKGLTTNETPSPTLPDDLTARMVALTRRIATVGIPNKRYSEDVDEARALVAEMEPVDGDLVEARKLAADVEDAPYGDLEGLALAAIKRGRALERGEGKCDER